MATSNYKLYRMLGINVMETPSPNMITQQLMEYSESIDKYIEFFDKLATVKQNSKYSYIEAIPDTLDIELSQEIYRYPEIQKLFRNENLRTLVDSIKNLDYHLYFDRYGKKALPVLVIGECSHSDDIDHGLIECLLLELNPTLTRKYLFWKDKQISMKTYYVQTTFNLNLFEKLIVENIIKDDCFKIDS